MLPVPSVRDRAPTRRGPVVDRIAVEGAPPAMGPGGGPARCWARDRLRRGGQRLGSKLITMADACASVCAT